VAEPEVDTEALPPPPGPALAATDRLKPVREARDWLRRLGELGIAIQLAVAAIVLVWVARHVVGIHSTAFLLVVLLLPPVTYLALRSPDELTGRDWGSPVRGFGAWLASLGEIGRVIELVLLAAFLMWFTSAVVGVDSAPLLALELVAPPAVYLILTGREPRP
jgi:hypothetical protein